MNFLVSADRDGDEQLTEDEFSDLPSEGASVDQSLSMPVSQERREEFRHLIDKNKNGKADRAELLVNCCMLQVLGSSRKFYINLILFESKKI